MTLKPYLLLLLVLKISTGEAFALDGVTGVASAHKDAQERRFALTIERAEAENRCRDLMADINAGGRRSAGHPVHAAIDPAIDALRIEHSSGQILEGSKGRVLFLHGLGMDYSGPSSWNQHIATLSLRGPAKSGSTAAYLQGLEDYLPLSSEAIDLPGSVTAVPLNALYAPHPWAAITAGLNPVVDYIAEKIRAMKQETPDLPVYVVARSAYARILPAVNQKYPGLISKMILISPTYPGGKTRDAAQLAGSVAEATASGTSMLYDIVGWFFEATRKIDWRKRGYFGSTPTLILTGSTDLQVLPEDRADLQRLAEQNFNITYVDIEGAGHDVFATSKQLKQSGRRAWAAFFGFLSQP